MSMRSESAVDLINSIVYFTYCSKHAATKVTSLGTYEKASTISDITSNDSLVTAIGKLEAKTDDVTSIPQDTIEQIVDGTYKE